MKNLIVGIIVSLLSAGALATESPIEAYKSYREAVNATAELSRDAEVRSMIKKYGLDIMNFTWEDAGRTKGSSVGPNISDMSIQVHVVGENGQTEPVLMPVVRYPNFDDKTADLSPNDFVVLVGNEKGDSLKKVSLTEYLGNFRKYLSVPEAWTAETDSLLAPRDTHVLTSAQISYLPVPQGQKATFNPVLFNYQSSENNSAVLSILVTREGSSATIINNSRDGFESGPNHGQRLFFNANGMRASLTGERLSDFHSENPELPFGPQAEVKGDSGLNMVLLIQVPLKHKPRPIMMGGGCTGADGLVCLSMMESVMTKGIEDAVIGHGDLEGPFTEIDRSNDLDEEQQVIERDDRFPIRVTVQFYKATATSEMGIEDVKAMKKQIDKVYANADYVGSLVTEGETLRPTEHTGPACKASWWPMFKGSYLELNEERHQADASVQLLEGEAAFEALLFQKYGPYWGFWCADEDSMTRAMDFVTSYEAPVVEDNEKN